ncbi:MAG: alpha/beta fold hydrolase [Sphingomicrobium sp.]
MTRLATRLGIIGIAERGGGDALPITFLHGVGSDKSAWLAQLAAFGTERRAIALDFPGYGESDPASPDNAPAHDRFADAILAALDALVLDQVHLCGLSLGGVVALALAHRAPDRIASLTLADSFARHPDGEAILERSLAASADMRALAAARVPLLLAPGADPVLAASLLSVMAAIDPIAFRLASAAVWPADQRHRASLIGVPTLILCGDEDRVTPPKLSDELATMIPGALGVRIAAAGHLPNLEQPAAFNAELGRFLSECEAKCAG